MYRNLKKLIMTTIKKTKSKRAPKIEPTKKDVVVSFMLTLPGFNEVESVVDEVRKKMRGHAVKFNKRYVYEALLTKGIQLFDADQFVVDYVSEKGGNNE